MIRGAGLLLVGLVLGASADAKAASAPEWRCHQGRTKTTAIYIACIEQLQASLFAGAFSQYEERLSRCRVKYAFTWTKLQKQASGTGVICDGPRFVDEGDGTVTDNLTGLQWEKKTDDGSIHDVDDRYAWSATPPYQEADGPTFTGFLTTLGTTCFAGHCDWRLPKVIELATILSEPFPCASSPCIDPVFGPTAEANYWTVTTNVAIPNGAWSIYFGYGVLNQSDGKQSERAARAVRGAF